MATLSMAFLDSSGQKTLDHDPRTEIRCQTCVSVRCKGSCSIQLVLVWNYVKVDTNDPWKTKCMNQYDTSPLTKSRDQWSCLRVHSWLCTGKTRYLHQYYATLIVHRATRLVVSLLLSLLLSLLFPLLYMLMF
jgi:hypothetical protein